MGCFPLAMIHNQTADKFPETVEMAQIWRCLGSDVDLNDHPRGPLLRLIPQINPAMCLLLLPIGYVRQCDWNLHPMAICTIAESWEMFPSCG